MSESLQDKQKMINALELSFAETKGQLEHVGAMEEQACSEIDLMMERLSVLRATRDSYRDSLKVMARNNKAVEEQLALKRAEYEEEKANQKVSDSSDIYDRILAHIDKQDLVWKDKANKHQWNGALTLAAWGSALLADEPGLGKSLTSIMYLDMLPAGSGYGASKALVVVPNDLVSEFTREFQTWAPHRSVLPVQGANAAHRALVQDMTKTMKEFIIVTNYESLWQDYSWISQIEYDAVLIDEFHNAKNANGLTFKAIADIPSRNFLPITATFILNEPSDIFPALHLVAPKSFPAKKLFLDNFCEKGHNDKWTFQPGGEAALMDRLGSRIVKRSLEDAEIVLPTQHHRDIDIPFSSITDGQQEIINEIAENGMLMSGDSAMPINAIIAAITRERQACAYPNGIKIRMSEEEHDRLLSIGKPLEDITPVGEIVMEVSGVESAKVEYLKKRLLTMQEKGKRSVVFSQFTEPLKDLEKQLNAMGIRTCTIIGETPTEVRNRIKKDFRRQPNGNQPDNYKYDVVLCNYKTGGVGLTLTGATYMCKLDEEWSPGKNEQAHRRIYRIGQTEETMVETLRIVKTEEEGQTIDQWMKKVNEIKQLTVDGFETEVGLVEMYKEFKGISESAKVTEKKSIEDILSQPMDDLFA